MKSELIKSMDQLESFIKNEIRLVSYLEMGLRSFIKRVIELGNVDEDTKLMINKTILPNFIRDDLELDISYDSNIEKIYFRAFLKKNDTFVVDTYYALSESDIYECEFDNDYNTFKILRPSVEVLVVAQFIHKLIEGLRNNGGLDDED